MKNITENETYRIDGAKDLAEFKMGVNKVQLTQHLKLEGSAAYRFGSNHNNESHFDLRLQYQFY